MAGRHARPGMPSVTTPTTASRQAARHSTASPRTFAGTPLTVDGVTRDALSAGAFLGTSIPKGPLAFGVAAAHGAASFTLAQNESSAQLDVAGAIAGIDAISKARAIRSVSRNAEGIAPTSSPLHIQSPRLLASGRGPRVTVQGMVAGDVARAVAEFDRYGYTVNRAMIPPRLDPMEHYSFWQLAEPTVLGALSQGDRQTVASAFERGVTVWTAVAEIGTHPANPARAGVSY